jgi:prepilin peptidase dependent protein B
MMPVQRLHNPGLVSCIAEQCLSRRNQGGLTLVELMISLSLSLFLITIAMSLWTGQQRENKSLLSEARLLQDLSTVLQGISRNVRRSGYWPQAHLVLSESASAVPQNPYTPLRWQTAPASTGLQFFVKREVENPPEVTFELDQGVLRQRIGLLQTHRRQALTDPEVIHISRFEIIPQIERVPLAEHCPGVCEDVTAACPSLMVRGLSLRIEGHLTRQPSIHRQLSSYIRLRNDEIQGACPA